MTLTYGDDELLNFNRTGFFSEPRDEQLWVAYGGPLKNTINLIK